MFVVMPRRGPVSKTPPTTLAMPRGDAKKRSLLEETRVESVGREEEESTNDAGVMPRGDAEMRFHLDDTADDAGYRPRGDAKTRSRLEDPQVEGDLL